MAHHRIRIRTDIFKSQEFALHEKRVDEVPMILPTPVPSIRNNFFKPLDQQGVGMDLDCDFNDNLISKNIQGQIIDDEHSLEGVNNCIDFVNGSYFCSVCHIGLPKDNVGSHLREKRHKFREIKKEQACKKKIQWPFTEKDLEKLRIKGIDFVSGRFSCSICHIFGLNKSDLRPHLQGKRHVKRLNEGNRLVEKAKKQIMEMRLNKELKKEQDKELEEYKQKQAIKNEISAREFILKKKFKNGNMELACSLCDVVVISEKTINAHLSGKLHKANYDKRYGK